MRRVPRSVAAYRGADTRRDRIAAVVAELAPADAALYRALRCPAGMTYEQVQEYREASPREALEALCAEADGKLLRMLEQYQARETETAPDDYETVDAGDLDVEILGTWTAFARRYLATPDRDPWET